MSLTLPQLEAFAQGLADTPSRWAHLIREPSGAREYGQIWSDEDVNAWVISWRADGDTGWHDHDESAGGIAVIRGRVREERLVLGAEPRVTRARAGDTLVVPPTAIHRVRHDGDGLAVTIHAYSPPLRRMGAYWVGPGGELERRSLPSETELEVQAAAA